MKTSLILAAAASLVATGAFAQTSPGPSQSSAQQRDTAGMSPPSVTSPNGNLSGGDYSSSNTGSGTTSASDLQMREGKWMMGNRAATPAEIAEHKRMAKANKGSKPM